MSILEGVWQCLIKLRILTVMTQQFYPKVHALQKCTLLCPGRGNKNAQSGVLCNSL